MENKDANTDYQKVVRVGEQMWETVEITVGNTFLFKICVQFSSPTRKKSHAPKVPIPTQNSNLT